MSKCAIIVMNLNSNLYNVRYLVNLLTILEDSAGRSKYYLRYEKKNKIII